MDIETSGPGLSGIKQLVDGLAHKIEAPAYVLPTYGQTEDLARPHIEVDERGYHYVVVERGMELKRKTTGDVDELLYLIFRSVVSEVASKWEAAHRLKGEDSRRRMFAKKIELMTRLEPEWAARLEREINGILATHPYRDK
jgi:hypothetical protein